MNGLDSFCKYLRFERNYSEHTILSYQNDIRQFSQYLIIHLDIDNIDHALHHHVRSWLVHLMTSDYTPKSINRKLSSLKSFYKFQKKVGRISHNPASKVQGPKLSKRLPVVVHKLDLNHALEESPEENSFQTLRDSLIFNLLYQTGMRRSELIHLKDKDIDTGSKQLKVLGKGNKERLIPISTQLLELIGDYQELRNERFDNSEYLLLTDRGLKMYPKFVYNKVRSWIAGISSVDKKSPHILRHSFATHLADNGAELNAIKELLGHSSLAATEIYTHNSIERLKGVYQKAHPRSSKKR